MTVARHRASDRAADRAAALPPRHPAADVAAWVLAAAVVSGVIAGTALWFDRRAGEAGVVEQATPIDLSPLPPPPAVTAAAEPAPDMPQVDAPEQPEPPDMPDRPLPRLAAADTPVARRPAPAVPQSARVPDLAPGGLASPPPPPSPEPVAEPEPVPEPPPTPEPKPPRELEPEAEPEARPKPATKAPSAASIQAAPQAETRGQAKASASKGRLRDLEAAWGAKIRSRIERRKAYPASAKGAEGTVGLRLTVTRGGALSAVGVTASSGNAALDAAGVKAVKSAGKFPAAPKELGDGSYGFMLTVTFTR